MRIPVQLAIIFAICLAGEFLNRIVGIPLPGNIIGMILLLILLCLKIVKLEHISTVSTVLLKYLPLFFLPPSIAIMAVGDDILGRWPLLLTMCIAFTVITMAATGISTQFLIRLQERHEGQKANAGIDGAGGATPSEKGGKE